MIKDLDWLVYVGTPGERRLIVREIARENNYPIYKFNDKYYRTEDMREIDGRLFNE